MINVTELVRDVVVIGASAGGLHAVGKVLESLPATFPGSIAIVMHRSPMHAADLGHLLARASSLEVKEARHRERFRRGKVYIAPRDRHLTLVEDQVRLDRGPRQHHSRPSVDRLFRSAALTFGPRVVGLLLTGSLSDGVGGLIAIKASGGVSLVQHPDEAQHASMPVNALIYDEVDGVVRLGESGAVLETLAEGLPVKRALFRSRAYRFTRTLRAAGHPPPRGQVRPSDT